MKIKLPTTDISTEIDQLININTVMTKQFSAQCKEYGLPIKGINRLSNKENQTKPFVKSKRK